MYISATDMHFLSFQRCYEVLKAWSFQKDNFGSKKTTHLANKLRLCRLKDVKHTAVFLSLGRQYSTVNHSERWNTEFQLLQYYLLVGGGLKLNFFQPANFLHQPGCFPMKFDIRNQNLNKNFKKSNF